MEDAAAAYERAAEHYELIKSNHEAARAWVEAAKCRKGVAPGTAVDAYGKVNTTTNQLMYLIVLTNHVSYSRFDYSCIVVSLE